MKRKDIIIGEGDLIVSGIGQGDYEGIGIFSQPKHGQEINSPVPMELLKDSEPCNCEVHNRIAGLGWREPEIAIWFKDMKAVRLFQDEANGAALRMNGYVIENKKGETK